MQSDPLLVQMRLSILPCVMLALAACAGAPPIVATPGACSSLLPEEWRKPIEGDPLPEGNDIGSWIQFADAQTGQLDKMNDRMIAAIGIVERCEARDRLALERADRKWWQLR